MSDKEALELLLKAYVELNRMKSCEPGERSHALAWSTDFIKRQINTILKRLNKEPSHD